MSFIIPNSKFTYSNHLNSSHLNCTIVPRHGWYWRNIWTWQRTRVFRSVSNAVYTLLVLKCYTDIFGKRMAICSIWMDVAGREGPQRAVDCPVNACDALLAVTKSVAFICVLFSAFFLVQQFSMECLPFLQNAVISSCCGSYSAEPSFMVLTFKVLAGNLRMTPVCWVVLLSTIPARVSSHLCRGCYLLTVSCTGNAWDLQKGCPGCRSRGHNCVHSRRGKDVQPELCSGCKTNWHARQLNLRCSLICATCWHTWIHNSDGSWLTYCLSCWALWVQNVHNLGMANLSRFCRLVTW